MYFGAIELLDDSEKTWKPPTLKRAEKDKPIINDVEKWTTAHILVARVWRNVCTLWPTSQTSSVEAKTSESVFLLYLPDTIHQDCEFSTERAYHARSPLTRFFASLWAFGVSLKYLLGSSHNGGSEETVSESLSELGKLRVVPCA